MKKLTRSETAAFLAEHDRYTILTHRRPDGDTLGCAAALCRGLRKLGKTAHILENPEISDRFRWLHQGLTKEQAEAGDTVVSVDVASPNMLPDRFQCLLGGIALRIDHHGSATSFTEQELVDPASASCAACRIERSRVRVTSRPRWGVTRQLVRVSPVVRSRSTARRPGVPWRRASKAASAPSLPTRESMG